MKRVRVFKWDMSPKDFEPFNLSVHNSFRFYVGDTFTFGRKMYLVHGVHYSFDENMEELYCELIQ